MLVALKYKQSYLRKLSCHFTCALVGCGLLFDLNPPNAHSQTPPKGFSYQGRILKPDGHPLEASSVSFNLRILSPGTEKCILRDEQHILDMSDSKGIFQIPVGAGSTNFTGNLNPSPALSWESLFSNSKSFTGLNCDSGSTFSPSGPAGRKLQVLFNDNSGSGWVALSPEYSLESVPYSQYAQSSNLLGDKGANEFLQVNSLSAALSQSNLESVFATPSKVAELEALLAGASAQYVRPGNSTLFTGSISFSQAPTFSGTITAGDHVANKNYCDSNLGGKSLDSEAIANLGANDQGKTLVWSGTRWAAQSLSHVLPAQSGHAGKFLKTDGTSSSWEPVTGGTVTSVALSAPSSVLTVANSPVTNSGAIALGLANQAANKVFAGPISGADAVPTFRHLTISDIQSSVAGNFMAASAACPTGQSLTYTAVSDQISCQTYSLTSSQVTGALGFTPADVNALAQKLTSPLSTKGDFLTHDGSAHVRLPAGSDGQILAVNSASSTGLEWINPIWFTQSGNSFSGAATLGTNDNFPLNFETNNSTRFTITSDGKVGIGTTSPSSKFDVNEGDARINGLTLGMGAGQNPLNTVFGMTALSSNSTGAYNVAVGADSLQANTGGLFNTAVGTWALKANTTGNYNTAIGQRALLSNTTGSVNTAVGGVLGANTTGGNNTAVGDRNLSTNTSGSSNTSMGFQTLRFNLIGNNNSAVGVNALTNSTGSNNTALGSGAGSNLTAGDGNIAIGANTTFANASGSNQLNIGNAIYGNLGSGNVGIGTSNPEGLLHLRATDTTSYQSSLLGASPSDVLRLSNDDQTNFDGYTGIFLSHKSSNIAMGRIALYGSFWEGPTAALTFGLRGTSGGGGTIERMRIAATGNVGIGTAAPEYRLDVAGDLRITGTPYRTGGDVAWQVPSDARLKNVTGLYKTGLNDLTQLEMIRFRYKQNNPVGADTSKEYTGVLAQDVQRVIPEAVLEDPKTGFLNLNTTPIFWATINAIKELHHQLLKLVKSSIEHEKTLKSLAELTVKKVDLEKQLNEKDRQIEELKRANTAIQVYLCGKDPGAPFCRH